MKFHYLGTAAAEGVPAPFCACQNCVQARKEGGKSIRGRSQALIDDRLLIDFPADTCYRALHGQLDLVKIRHCLITHNHQDHLYPEEAAMRAPGFAHPDNDVPLTFYGTADTLAPLRSPQLKRTLESGRVRLQEIVPFEPFSVINYTVTAFPANHEPAGATIYQITDGAVTVLYAHDTGYFFDEVWAWLEREKPSYDLISLDCTGGTYTEGYRNGHMRLEVVCEAVERLKGIGCIRPSTRLFVNHFSHNGISTHSDLCFHAEKLGLEVAYDGCELTV